MEAGSITFSTALDNADLEKELGRLKEKILRQMEDVGRAEFKRNGLEEQLKVANEALEAINGLKNPTDADIVRLNELHASIPRIEAEIRKWNSSGLRVATGSGTTVSYKVLNSSTAVKRMVVTLDYPNKQAFIDGGSKVSLSNIDVSSSMCTIRLLRPNSNSYAMDAKVYSCKIENAGKAVRDFVPCINPSGKAGLYDLVTNTFYDNANTTGAFTYGPAV